MSKELTILDWATQYYCALDDHDILADLLPLRKHEVNNTPIWEVSDAEKKRRPNMPAPTTTRARELKDGQFDDDQQPLHAVFYKLRTALGALGPAYLGLDETEEMLDRQQPWASPLDLQRMARPTAPRGGTQLFESTTTASSLEPFSSPFNSPARPAPATQPSDPTTTTRESSGPAIEHECHKDPAGLDIPEIIYLLITAENARRHFATELLSKKHAARSVGEQSERWQHHFAKRNIAAETKFENILVALKELVVLRAVVDLDGVQFGELRRVLENVGAQNARVRRGQGFDAARCLAVLNLMFPLDPLHTDARYSLAANRWQQRYAFPLQHVPSPRVQLHQLLCEAEAWINGDERVTTSVAARSHRLHTDSDSDSDFDADSRCAKRARVGEPHAPRNCPTWLAAARSFAWGQLKQSCQAYLRDTQQKIMDQHRALNPWVPMAADQPAKDMPESAEIQVPEFLRAYGKAGSRAARVFASESHGMLDEVMEQLQPDATVVERIALHSKMMNIAFSGSAAYKMLGQPQ
ncbi:hypothetical protein GGF43_005254 [Coemansia sp. RSA 2618]|nr:hypothetical protein GGF43_005254 [Coemansia sp. RSA 2618]